MKFFVFLLLKCLVNYGECVRLNPLENNDKLQWINTEFVAEWQWESWPIKQNLSEKEIATPGPRINAALWKDNNGQNWYLFGGQPIDPESEKIYSDIWKYSVSSRVWERVLPLMSSLENKGKFSGKIGGMVSLRVNLFDDAEGSKPHKRSSDNIVLCGRSAKRETTKPKKNFWSNFSRRKAPDPKNVDESKSLAVYGPRTSKSNTVWQIDLKDKLWTGYVCCCDTSNYDKLDPSLKNLEYESNSSGILYNQTAEDVQKSQISMNVRIDKTEDEIEREQEHLTIADSRTKKKKINQMKKKKGDSQNGEEKKRIKKTEEAKQNSTTEKAQVYPSGTDVSDIVKSFPVETVLAPKNQTVLATVFKNTGGERNPKEEKVTSSMNKTTSADGEIMSDDWDGKFNSTEGVRASSKSVSKYCPDFTDEGEPVSWCDGSNDALITADLSSPQIVLWIFNLKTSHWSQQAVEIAEDTQWPACSNSTSTRYAGAGEEVYILCSAPETENFLTENSTQNGTEGTKTPELDNSTKLVYRISSKRLILESLGKLKLTKFFGEADHADMWKNESTSILKVIRLPSNETIMIFAYKENVDLWILMKNQSGGHYFDRIENVWRGSASKWFSKYNATNYNFHFVSESNAASTVLIPNPRTIFYKEYWPRERGRFIVRILKNENMKNHGFGNRTREHNLTYDLLQSDMNLPISESSFSHSYNFKVIIFFGISLAIFAIFGFIVFLKKCVNCPSRILMTNDCHKSPPIIRYSVMQDDLLYPVA